MQTVAENKITVTKELYREGMKRIIQVDYTPTVKKLLIGVTAAWLLLMAYTVWRGGSIVALSFEFVFIILAVTYVAVIIPRGRIKKGWKALLDRSGGSMERFTSFYEDRLEVETSAGNLILNYEDVTGVLETEHMMIIRSAEHLGVIVALDGFSKGSREDVLALIKEWSR